MCAGLLAIAVGQLMYFYLTHRYREQARSHIWISASQNSRDIPRYKTSTLFITQSV